MGIIADIAGLAGSGVFGGIFGFGAMVVKRKLAMQEAKAKFERDIKLREFDRVDAQAARSHEIKLHELNQMAADRETEREMAIVDMQGRDAARVASQADQRALSVNPSGSQWTIDVLRMVRPVLTALHVLMLAGIFYAVKNNELQTHIVHQIVFLAGMTVTWWFGERPPRAWTITDTRPRETGAF